MTIKELCQRTFDLIVQKNWLRIIDKQTKKVNGLHTKMLCEQKVLIALWDKYEKIYESGDGEA